MATPLQILDTNILVHYVRDNLAWTQIRRDYELLLVEPTPLISIVIAGELRSLANQWNWGAINATEWNSYSATFQSFPWIRPIRF